MAKLWCPGAEKVDRSMYAGTDMEGGQRRAIWHTTEGGFAGSHNSFEADHYYPHVMWDPITGELRQYLPANCWALALVTGNKSGTVVIQIEVVGHAVDPFTSHVMKGGDVLMDWLRTWGIPDVSPPKAWLPYPASYGNTAVRGSGWSRSGHFGHEHVPGNDHGDPGAIDPAKLFALGGDDPMTPDDFAKIQAMISAAQNNVLTTVGSRLDADEKKRKDWLYDLLYDGTHLGLVKAHAKLDTIIENTTPGGPADA